MTGTLAPTAGPLALRDDQTEWTEPQRAMLATLGVDDDVTDAELQVFLYECQRRRLDPFAKQIHLIGRRDRQAGRKVYRSQTSIDGFRLIARRAANRDGIDYGYEDTIWYDRRGNEHRIWLSPEPPAAAKVVVVRSSGMRYDAEARFDAYAARFPSGDLMNQWATMPETMIAKCAEALALRKAFPEDLGGLYTDEEMGQADNTTQATGGHAAGEPAQPAAQPGGNGQGKGRQARQPAATAADPASPDNRKWLEDARAAVFTADAAALERLTTEGRARTTKGQLTKDDAKALSDLISARRTDLRSEALRATQLSPDDGWAACVGDVTCRDDAIPVMDEATRQRNAGEMTEERFTQIRAAVNGRIQMVQIAQAASVPGEVITSDHATTEAAA